MPFRINYSFIALLTLGHHLVKRNYGNLYYYYYYYYYFVVINALSEL